jgi:hypothetical protein
MAYRGRHDARPGVGRPAGVSKIAEAPPPPRPRPDARRGPKKPLLTNEDGTYRRPVGRGPPGKTWCGVSGKWVDGHPHAPLVWEKDELLRQLKEWSKARGADDEEDGADEAAAADPGDPCARIALSGHGLEALAALERELPFLKGEALLAAEAELTQLLVERPYLQTWLESERGPPPRVGDIIMVEYQVSASRIVEYRATVKRIDRERGLFVSFLGYDDGDDAWVNAKEGDDWRLLRRSRKRVREESREVQSMQVSMRRYLDAG